MQRGAGVRMCMQNWQKWAVLPLLTPNQRPTCVASRWKSSFTWKISVRGHCVMTAPSFHTKLTLPPLLLLLLNLPAYPFIIPPLVRSSDLRCFSDLGMGSTLL